MSEQLIAEAFLPGLRCLKLDLEVIAQEYVDSVTNIIQEFEAKLDLGRSVDSRPRTLSVTSPGSMEEMKNRVTKMFSARSAAVRPNIPNLFQLRRSDEKF
ncbi:hypothetical protein CEXT_550171 [Caerostris extrusa]|uniref:Uncharacterized protein n=1 Tax=Caerostris extrusa TaxID=172846 RepID=A0AAV4XN83_CAEEX|nr:hypothetical protein CEXT_550171 [Caerostris extrusa]